MNDTASEGRKGWTSERYDLGIVKSSLPGTRWALCWGHSPGEREDFAVRAAPATLGRTANTSWGSHRLS